MKILVVNENRVDADWLANLLNRDPRYRALAVYSAADALQHAMRLKFDLALVRGAAEDSLGTEVGEHLQALMHDCKVVLMLRAKMIEPVKRFWPQFECLPSDMEAEVLWREISLLHFQFSCWEYFRKRDGTSLWAKPASPPVKRREKARRRKSSTL